MAEKTWYQSVSSFRNLNERSVGAVDAATEQKI